jgi:hypothetical protein
MTKATINTYTVKTRNFEYRAAKKVKVYRGEELVGEIEPV